MKAPRGYTLVELMMAISAFTIGVTGLIALQKITIVSNQHAKNLAVASHIAQSWLDMLAMDGQQWNNPSQLNPASDLNSDTLWLNAANSNPGQWMIPSFSAVFGAPGFGPGFDPLGAAVATPVQAAYCTHIRLTWLYSDTVPTLGDGLIRAEVRVFWQRDGANGLNNWCAFGASNTVAPDLTPNANQLHMVQKVSAIRQNKI